LVKKGEKDMTDDLSKTTEMDREFDIIDEFKKILDETNKAIEESKIDDLPDKISYLKFLVNELDNALSGEYVGLRSRRIIVKKA
jgi:hypothetical protein